MNFLACLILSVVVLFGCRTTGDVEKAAPSSPEWVTKAPGVKGMICAVGISEPAFYKDEAKETAAENARKELARSLSVDIKNIMIEVISDRGYGIDEAVVMEVSAWTTSAVVENSVIMGYWYDAEGVVSPRRDMTYVLCCIPRRFNKDDLAKKLKDHYEPVSGNYDEIGRTAGEIIDKLQEGR